MSLTAVRNFLVFIFTRTIVFYVFIYLALHLVFDFSKMERKFNIATLNRIRPSADKVLRLSQSQGSQISSLQIYEYLHYYQQVDKLYPGRSDAYGMFGFCYFYLNDYAKSVSFYDQARKKEPGVYIFPYNLGIVEYRRQNYAEAVQAFAESLIADPRRSIEYIFSSKVYQQIFAETSVPTAGELVTHMRKHTSKAQVLAALSYYELKDYAKALYVAQEGLQKNSDFKNVYVQIINDVWLKNKDYPQVVASSKSLIEQNPRNIKAYDNLIISLQQMGETQRLEEVKLLRAKISTPYNPIEEFLNDVYPKIY